MQRSGIEDKRSLRSLDSVTLHRGYALRHVILNESEKS